MKSSLIRAVLVFCIIEGALAFRLPGLGMRPMHHDEANQAVKCGVLQETGSYTYDASDHHGPSLYYITLPFAWLESGKNFSGTTESTYRMVTVVFGVGAILLVLLLQDGLGRPAAFVGALLMVISPAMVFYSRCYIQEMLLVFFTLGAILSGWRYYRGRAAGWAAGTGLFLGLMFVTKETAVMAYASMAGACAAVSLWEGAGKKDQGGAFGGMRKLMTGVFGSRHFPALVVAAVFIWILFFTSFFTNWKGPLDSLLAYKSYAGKSVDSPHVHPWYYYLRILAYWKTAPGPAWSEGLILVLSVIGFGAVFSRKVDQVGGHRVFLRFLGVYTLLMVLVYSVIPYKTPWCLLSFLSGLIMVAGVGAIFLVQLFRGHLVRVVLACLLLAGGYGLARQAWLTNFKFYADPRNPYVYAHTSRDFLNLVKRIEAVSALHPQGRKMLVAVVASPYEMWPLPWYLRAYPRAGYWPQAGELQAGLRPDVAVASSEEEAAVQARLGAGYHIEYYGLRPDVLLTLFISPELWEAYMEKVKRLGG